MVESARKQRLRPPTGMYVEGVPFEMVRVRRQNNNFKPRDNTRPGPAALTAPKPAVGLPAASNRTWC